PRHPLLFIRYSPDLLVPLCLQSSGHPGDLHSFPTRRSSDLGAQQLAVHQLRHAVQRREEPDEDEHRAAPHERGARSSSDGDGAHESPFEIGVRDQLFDRGCLTGGSPSSTSRVRISSPSPAASSSVSIRPSAVRSAEAASRWASASCGATTVTASSGVFCETFASDLMRRSTIAARATESTSEASCPAAAVRSGAAS